MCRTPPSGHLALSLSHSLKKLCVGVPPMAPVPGRPRQRVQDGGRPDALPEGQPLLRVVRPSVAAGGPAV
jgi:hypothetical protein